MMVTDDDDDELSLSSVLFLFLSVIKVYSVATFFF
jgi:hypothetical protein